MKIAALLTLCIFLSGMGVINSVSATTEPTKVEQKIQKNEPVSLEEIAKRIIWFNMVQQIIKHFPPKSKSPLEGPIIIN